MTQRSHAPLVLIVDDNVNNLATLGYVLAREEYRMLVARSGSEALAAVDLALPDLILLDVMMPGMDGYETCRQLRAMSQLADVPIIFLTARTSEDDVIRGFGVGASDYVSKPFREEELLARIRTHIRLAHLKGELERSVTELREALDQVGRLNRERESYLRHELNNAIGPILGYSDLLLGQAEVPPEKQRLWLLRIRESASSMRDMLTELKRLQAFERAGVHLDLERLDLLSLVSTEAERVSRQLDCGVPVDLRSSLAHAPADVDASLFPGVVRNLLKNAMEHVMHEEDPEPVRVVVRDEEARYAIAVTNGGDAVPAERLATFFEKFNSTKLNRGGTGLGTSFVRAVTMAHGGTVGVESDPATGTTVTVRVPKPGSPADRSAVPLHGFGGAGR